MSLLSQVKEILELPTLPRLLLTVLSEQWSTLNVIIIIILTYDLLDPILGTFLLDLLVADLTGVPRLLAPEEAVVLEHEDEVKANGEDTETKLGRVSRYGLPVICEAKNITCTGIDRNKCQQTQHISNTVIAVTWPFNFRVVLSFTHYILAYCIHVAIMHTLAMYTYYTLE